MLAQPTGDPHDRAVRWRQLVELAARAGPGADLELVNRAIEEIRSQSASIDERVRVAAAAAVAPLPMPAALVAAFAADSIAVAAPILASARLTASEWRRVADGASRECREFIATMRAETSASGPSPPPKQEREPPRQQEPELDAPVPSISDVVARIERIRQSRGNEPAPSPPESAADAVDETSRLFRWESNESGEIEWVEGAPRGALIGQSIAQSGLESGVGRSVERAFAARAPFRDGVLELARGGAVGGTWKISGVPAFEPATGRFAGYRGLAERSGAWTGSGAAAPAAGADPLRELAHEIKTPLNAIIGFAEIIAGEYLGPAQTSYRERANEIVQQARLLLTAVEDIDFAARVKSQQAGSPSELYDSVARAWESVEREAQARSVTVAVEGAEEPALCALTAELAERLVERMMLAVIGSAREGESLTFRVGTNGDCCTLRVNRPASLEGADLRVDRNRRAGDTETLPLRLVMGLARTAGGELDTTGSGLTLRLPKA